MSNTRTLALLTVALLGVFVIPLDAKTLLEANAQAEANILGSELWCGVCRYIASLNAKQLHRIASQVLTLGEALMLVRCVSTFRHRFLCLISSLAKLRVVDLKKRVSESSQGSVSSYHCLGLVGDFGVLSKGESLGYSLSTAGEFIVPACRANPFCNTVNFDESEFEENTVFDFVCGRCKRLAQAVLGRTDLVVTDENLRTVFAPFCQSVRFIGRSPKGCIDAIITRFKEIYGSSTAILKPANVCQLYGLCALATTPSPKTAPSPASAAESFYTTK